MDLTFCAVATLGRQIITSKRMPLAHGAVVHFLKIAGFSGHGQRNGVQFQCDNNSLVSCISKGYSKDPSVMHLLRSLWFFVAFFDICIFAEHIAWATNCAADMLSRNNVTNFSCYIPRHTAYPLHCQLHC